MADIKEILEKADDAYYSMRYDEAIKLYKHVLSLSKNNLYVKKQIQKAELNKLSKSNELEDLPPEALQLYKRSRSFIATGDLAGAIKLLKYAIEISTGANIDFPDAQSLLENIENAYKADVFRKQAFEEINENQWVKAEMNLNIALDFDPTNDAIKTLLSHLRSLLIAQNLVYQLNSGIGN